MPHPHAGNHAANGAQSLPLGNLRPDTFLKHFRQISDLATAHRNAGAELVRAKKEAKESGVDLASFKLVQKLLVLDNDEAEGQLRRAIQYASWLEMPLGSQFSLFPQTAALADLDGGIAPVRGVGDKNEPPSDDASAEQRAWAAGEAGFTAGKQGKSRVDDNPYATGTALFVEFDRGFMRGQAAIAAKLGANAKQANPRKARSDKLQQAVVDEIFCEEEQAAPPESKRRGRPPGSRNRANGKAPEGAFGLS